MIFRLFAVLGATLVLANGAVAEGDHTHFNNTSGGYAFVVPGEWAAWHGTWVSGTEIISTETHDAFIAAMAENAECTVESIAALYGAFRPRVLHSLMIEGNRLSLAYPDGQVCTARYSIAAVGEVTASHTTTIYGSEIIGSEEVPIACSGLRSMVFTAPHRDGPRGWGLRVSARPLDELVTEAGGPYNWRPEGLQAFVPIMTDVAMVSAMLSSPTAVRANADLLREKCTPVE